MNPQFTSRLLRTSLYAILFSFSILSTTAASLAQPNVLPNQEKLAIVGSPNWTDRSTNTQGTPALASVETTLKVVGAPVRLTRGNNAPTTLNLLATVNILPKDKINVEEGGQGLLNVGNFLTVDIFPGTEFSLFDAQLEPDDSGLVLMNQTFGQTHVTLSDTANVRVKLETDFATIESLKPGTEFIICHDPTLLTCLDVRKGAVEAVGKGKFAGQLITIKAPAASYVLKNQPPATPVCEHTDEVDAWLIKTLSVGARQVEPLGALVDRWQTQPCPNNAAGIFVQSAPLASGLQIPASTQSYLTALRAPVQWTSGGNPSTVLNQDQMVSIQTNDAIKVDQDGRGLLKIGNLLTVDIIRGSEFYVTGATLASDGASSVQLKQAKGQIHVKLNNAANVNVTLETDFATITSLKPGTEFIVCHDPTALTCIDVTQGAVELVGKGKFAGSKKTVKSPAASYVLKDQPPAAPVCEHTDEVKTWLDKTLSVGGGQVEPLGALVDRWQSQPCPNSSPFLLADDFVDNLNGWTEKIGKAYFEGNAYHVKQTDVGFSYWTSCSQCINFTDIMYEAMIQKVEGPDNYAYGITFRGSSANQTFYDFGVDGNGFWHFGKFNSDGGFTKIIDFTTSGAVNKGNAKNKLRVISRGSSFEFYINDQLVGNAKDNTWASGTIGLGVSTAGLHIRVEYVRAWNATTSSPAIPPSGSTASSTASPTPSVPPGLYVTGLRVDPGPIRGTDLKFYPTFLNSTGKEQNYKWKIYIFRVETPNRSFGETSATTGPIPSGTVEKQSVGSWKLTPAGGPCENFIAQVGWITDDNKTVWFTMPNSQIFQKALAVCPP